MNRLAKTLLLKTQVFRDLYEGRKLRYQCEDGMTPVFLDYVGMPQPRYGYGRPAHPQLFDIMNRNRCSYANTLTSFLEFTADYQAIPVERPTDPQMPYWRNHFFQGLDPLSLYAFAAQYNPRTYIQVGSGNSTKFIARAVRERSLRTRIQSIDPEPRAEIDALCDEVVRKPLEDVDTGIFDSLDGGDILFVDGSHRAFMNSDVTVIFLEVLLRLRPGVLVYIDDIFLPLDYPPE